MIRMDEAPFGLQDKLFSCLVKLTEFALLYVMDDVRGSECSLLRIIRSTQGYLGILIAGISSIGDFLKAYCMYRSDKDQIV